MEDTRRQRFEAEAVVHLQAVYSAAYRLARREEDARDLAQETMLRAFRSFDRFTPGTNARAWLLTILYSIFVNRYRRERREPRQVPLDEEATRQLESPPTADADASLLDGPWGDHEVQTALDRLSEPFRDAVLLVDVEELSYEEAAAALGCAVGTVRSRLFRGRRLLAAALEGFARQRGLLPRNTESA